MQTPLVVEGWPTTVVGSLVVSLPQVVMDSEEVGLATRVVGSMVGLVTTVAVRMDSEVVGSAMMVVGSQAVSSAEETMGLVEVGLAMRVVGSLAAMRLAVASSLVVEVDSKPVGWEEWSSVG